MGVLTFLLVAYVDRISTVFQTIQCHRQVSLTRYSISDSKWYGYFFMAVQRLVKPPRAPILLATNRSGDNAVPHKRLALRYHCTLSASPSDRYNVFGMRNLQTRNMHTTACPVKVFLST